MGQEEVITGRASEPELIYDQFKRVLWYDLETRNNILINDPRYTDTAEVMLFLWAIDDEPVQCWDVYNDPDGMDPRLEAALNDPETVKRHFNGRSFDSEIVESYFDIECIPEEQDDIKETALRYNLPASLEKLGGAVELAADEAKDKAGKNLIKLFCIPLKYLFEDPETGKAKKWDNSFPVPKWVIIDYMETTGNIFAAPEDFPIEWAQFKRYGKQDVAAMRTIFYKLPKWNDTAKELLICAVNHRINKRGIRVDVEFARRMRDYCAKATALVTKKIMLLTDGVSPRSHAKYKTWLLEQMPRARLAGTGKPEIEKLRKEQGDLIPDHVNKVLDLQSLATSSSLGKYPKAVALAHPDDHRTRYYINVRGAGTTGRYGAAGGLQVHNFPRPTIKPQEIKRLREEVMRGVYDPDLLSAAPSMLRSFLIPSEGNIFRNADLSSIEGRSMAWLSDFDEQIEDYATGVNAYFKNGPLFGFTYDEIKAFKKSEDPDEYNLYMLCKVLELALIYQGGVSALCSMGGIYKLNMPKLADMLLERNLVRDEHLYQAKKALSFIRLTKKGRSSVAATKLTDPQWMSLDAAKRAWRERHGPVVSFWNTIQRNLIAAFENPGTEYYFGRNDSISMCFLDDIGWFGIRLPSGRVLSYYDAKIGGASEASYDEEGDEESEEEDKDERPVLLYRTFDKSGNPSRKYKAAHAGKVANNINQGTAASLLDEILIDMEYEDWRPVFHVHDQAISDLPKADPRTPKDLEALMCRERAWCPGLPLGAEGELMEYFAK